MMNDMAHVLIVDDEPRIVEVIRDYLADAGYRVSTARSGEEALQHLRSITPDLVVLDLGLPGVDGLDVARTVRQRSAVPIIMLTARSDEADRVVGLEIGADDYVVKPFSPRELLARVRAVLRRSSADASATATSDAPLVVGDLTVDRARRRVTRGDQVVDLTAGEFDVLAEMAASPGRVYTRGQLMAVLHGVDTGSGERAIDAHVKNIRRKLEPDPRRPVYVLTVHGVGYRLAEP